MHNIYNIHNLTAHREGSVIFSMDLEGKASDGDSAKEVATDILDQVIID